MPRSPKCQVPECSGMNREGGRRAEGLLSFNRRSKGRVRLARVADTAAQEPETLGRLLTGISCPPSNPEEATRHTVGHCKRQLTGQSHGDWVPLGPLAGLASKRQPITSVGEDMEGLDPSSTAEPGNVTATTWPSNSAARSTPQDPENTCSQELACGGSQQRHRK